MKGSGCAVYVPEELPVRMGVILGIVGDDEPFGNAVERMRAEERAIDLSLLTLRELFQACSSAAKLTTACTRA